MITVIINITPFWLQRVVFVGYGGVWEGSRVGSFHGVWPVGDYRGGVLS